MRKVELAAPSRCPGGGWGSPRASGPPGWRGARMLPDLLVGADALHMGRLRRTQGRSCPRSRSSPAPGSSPMSVGQVAADLAGQRELAVRERARAGKAGGDVAARAAVHAAARLALRAAALLHARPFSTITIFLLLPLRSISSAVNIPAGPAPTITTSAFIKITSKHKNSTP